MGRKKETINPTFDNFVVVSPKSIELAFYIRQFRRIHNFSQKEMADLCTKYGEHNGTKFRWDEISRYENYKTIPTPPKFQILMNTMDITPEML